LGQTGVVGSRTYEFNYLISVQFETANQRHHVGRFVMPDPKKSADRRALLAGAGTVGALAAAATALPVIQRAAAPVQSANAKPLPDTSAGYRLTEHVKRYYASTRI
jgi:hypothetical protein